MTVDFFRRRLVLGFELSLNVSSSLSVFLGSRVLRETNGQEGLLDLLLEEILLVQKENDRSVCEPFVVTDGIKQLEGFLHSILK